MKPDLYYELDKENILSNLKELKIISKFIIYERFDLSTKKLRNKLKKSINQIKNDKIEKYLINTEED